MLGTKDARASIKEPFAKQIRESLRRIKSGEMTEQEKEAEARFAEARNLYSFSWS